MEDGVLGFSPQILDSVDGKLEAADCAGERREGCRF
jgi:hypothetical protein